MNQIGFGYLSRSLPQSRLYLNRAWKALGSHNSCDANPLGAQEVL